MEPAEHTSTEQSTTEQHADHTPQTFTMSHMDANGAWVHEEQRIELHPAHMPRGVSPHPPGEDPEALAATREAAVAAAADMVAATRAGWQTVEAVVTELESLAATEHLGARRFATVVELLEAAQAETGARSAWMAAALAQEARLGVHFEARGLAVEARVTLENARMAAATVRNSLDELEAVTRASRVLATAERQIQESAGDYREAMVAVQRQSVVVWEKHRETLAALSAVEATWTSGDGGRSDATDLEVRIIGPVRSVASTHDRVYGLAEANLPPPLCRRF